MTKVFRVTEDSVPDPEVESVVSGVVGVMEVMELIVEGEGDEAGRPPGEVVANMRGVVVPEAEDEPDHGSTDVQGGIHHGSCKVQL